MTTRYILAGGNDRSTKTYWENLAKVIEHDKPLRVLSCMFAREPERWKDLHQEFNKFFKLAFGEKMTSELADPKYFREQISIADVVYLHGGDTKRLKELLAPFKNLQKMFEGKTVIGSSAGAQFLSRQYWSCGTRKTGTGSGLTPINTIVHYGSDFGSDEPRGPIDWEKAEQALQSVVGNEKVTRLPEGQFVKVEA